jgi:hypothetical protein
MRVSHGVFLYEPARNESPKRQVDIWLVVADSAANGPGTHTLGSLLFQRRNHLGLARPQLWMHSHSVHKRTSPIRAGNGNAVLRT